MGIGVLETFLPRALAEDTGGFINAGWEGPGRDNAGCEIADLLVDPGCMMDAGWIEVSTILTCELVTLSPTEAAFPLLLAFFDTRSALTCFSLLVLLYSSPAFGDAILTVSRGAVACTRCPGQFCAWLSRSIDG